MSFRIEWLVAAGLCIATHSVLTVQSAQASCAAPQSCVCEQWPTTHVLHGRFGSTDDGRTLVEVLDVLATDPLDPVHAGDLINGEIEADRCGVHPPDPAGGDEVLALWRGWPRSTLLECPDYSDCMDGACAASADDEACTSCLDAARTECPRDAELPRLVLVPWDTELDLGEGRVLASEEAGLLGARAPCLARFPAPPPPPCDDNIRVGVSDSCAATMLGSDARAGAALALLLLGCAVALRVRRRVPS